jgi:hypothetical protein
MVTAALPNPINFLIWLLGATTGPATGPVQSPPAPALGGKTKDEDKARLHLLVTAAGLATIVAAPTYLAYSKRKKKHMTPRDVMLGQSLENSSAQATGVLMTAVASPAIASAAAYILVQKLEDAGLITKSLGNATQSLLTVAAAGPAIQGIGGIVSSAFKLKGGK